MREDPKQPDETEPGENDDEPEFPDPGEEETYGEKWPDEDEAAAATEFDDPGLTGTYGHEPKDPPR